MGAQPWKRVGSRRVGPRRVRPSPKPPGLHTTARAQTCTFEGPGFKHHQNSTKGQKKENCGGRGKKREILGPPTLRSPTFSRVGLPPFGAPPFPEKKENCGGIGEKRPKCWTVWGRAVRARSAAFRPTFFEPNFCQAECVSTFFKGEL